MQKKSRPRPFPFDNPPTEGEENKVYHTALLRGLGWDGETKQHGVVRVSLTTQTECVHTYQTACLDGYYPDFAIVPKGLVPSSTNILFTIEVSRRVGNKIDTKHLGKGVLYSHLLLRAQRGLRHAAWTLVTDLRYIVFVRARFVAGNIVFDESEQVTLKEAWSVVVMFLRATSDTFLLNVNIPGFEFMQCVGEGATATAFKGNYERDGKKQQTVIKLFKEHVDTKAVEHELRMMKRLQISVLGSRTGRQRPNWFAMDIVGIPLSEAGGLSQRDVASIITILKQFAAAKVVHRDLEDRHWVRTDRGLNVIDFGYAVDDLSSQPWQGSTRLAPQHVLQSLKEDKSRAIKSKCSDDAITTVRMIYLLLHDNEKKMLAAIPQDNPDPILHFWNTRLTRQNVASNYWRGCIELAEKCGPDAEPIYNQLQMELSRVASM